MFGYLRPLRRRRPSHFPPAPLSRALANLLRSVARSDAYNASPVAVRAALDARATRQGWPALHAELARVDPTTAARLAPGDAQRIQRALEVWQVSGRPLSAWHGGGPGKAPEGKSTRGLALHLIALEPASRAWAADCSTARTSINLVAATPLSAWTDWLQ